jgi:hypothetical protein
MKPFPRCYWTAFSQICALVSMAMIAALLVAAPLAAQGTFTFFDAPDAGKGVIQGTVPWGINQSGVIAGYYIDANNLVHGFVRTASGVITEFDATGLSSTYVSGVNRIGQIVGNGAHKAGQTNYVHGFLRNPNGNFVHVDPAGLTGSQNTFNLSINDGGEIAGSYVDLAGVEHGFLRSPGGTYTVVDEPNAVTNESGLGTVITAINASGEVTGYYNDKNTFLIFGFTRDTSGNFMVFSAPGSGINFDTGTFAGPINASGQVAGDFLDDSFVSHPYLLSSTGVITEFSITAATQTFVESMNDAGVILGQYADSHSLQHGFLFSQPANFTFFTVPVPNTGTYPQSLNNGGHMTGYYYDVSGAVHGFLR